MKEKLSSMSLVVPFTGRINLLLLLCLYIALTGCASVKVSSVTSSDYMSLRRGDMLTTGELSVYTGAALQVVGVDKKKCDKKGVLCRKALMETIGLPSENRLSALAELWLKEAMERDTQFGELEHAEAILNAYLEAARYSYAYLFLTKRTPGMRAMEDRQTQVRDYYNFAVQKTLTTLFEYYRKQPTADIENKRDIYAQFGDWRITVRNEDVRFAGRRVLPEELIPASSLSFAGLRNQYRRDGLGAELVAVTSNRVVNTRSAATPFSETPFPAVTAVMSFPGSSLEEVLKTREVSITGYDPYGRESIELAETRVPLAANFT
ncbi:MAG: hypothetical protein WC373_07240, partial [Smithella sp.]